MSNKKATKLKVFVAFIIQKLLDFVIMMAYLSNVSQFVIHERLKKYLLSTNILTNSLYLITFR